MLDIDLAIGKEVEPVYNEDQLVLCPVCREEDCVYTVRLRRDTRGGR